PSGNCLLERFDFAHTNRDGKCVFFANQNIRCRGALFDGALYDSLGGVRQIVHYFSVPPTVISRILIVGSPTPTGIDWPSLPQIPTPLSSCRSLPTMLTCRRTVGPSPIRVAPLTGMVTCPSSIRYASLAENTNFPLVMSTWPPPK